MINEWFLQARMFTVRNYIILIMQQNNVHMNL